MGNSTTSNYLYCLNSKRDEISRLSSINLKAYNGGTSVKEESEEGFPLDVIDIKMYEDDENLRNSNSSNGYTLNVTKDANRRFGSFDSSFRLKLDQLKLKHRVIRIQKYYRAFKSRNLTIMSASTLGNISLIFKENSKIQEAPKLYSFSKPIIGNNNVKSNTRSKNSYNFNKVNSESIVFENKSSMDFSASESINKRSANVKFLDVLSTKSKVKECQLIRSRYNSSNITLIKSAIKDLNLSPTEMDSDEFGIKEYSNSSILVGLFNANRKLNGLGYYYIRNTQVYLKGQFLNNELNGFGFTQGDNELCYLGDWKKNKKNGYGIELWKNGTFYKGEFEDGLKQGIGSYFWENGANYKGQWYQNKMNGFVRLLIYFREF